MADLLPHRPVRGKPTTLEKNMHPPRLYWRLHGVSVARCLSHNDGAHANPISTQARASTHAEARIPSATAVASGQRVCTCKITPKFKTIPEHAQSNSKTLAWASEISSPSKLGNSHNQFQHLTAATEGISSTVNAGFIRT